MKRQQPFPAYGILLLVVLLVFLGYLYSSILPLSLGPRVILQPWLMAQGFLIYDQLADMHSPMMPLLLSWLQPLGASSLDIAHGTLVALVILTVLLLFWAIWREAGWLAGLGGVLVFACWSPAISYAKLWHESFLAPIYLLLLVWAYPSEESDSKSKQLGIGLLAGIALLVKQHAAVFLAAIIFWRFWSKTEGRQPSRRQLKKAALILVGACIPFSLFVLFHLLTGGTFRAIWFWVFKFNIISRYATRALRGLSWVEMQIFLMIMLLFLLVLARTISRKQSGDGAWQKMGWGLLLAAAGSITLYPRPDIFHLQASFPIFIWLLFLALQERPASQPLEAKASHRGLRILSICSLLIVSWLLLGYREIRPLFRKITRERVDQYSTLVVPAARIASYIKPEETVYLFPDSEPISNLYYLLGRPPPGFWAFTYPWYMIPPIKARIISMLEEKKPRWIVRRDGRSNISITAPDILAYIEKKYRPYRAVPWALRRFWLYRRLPES